MHNKEGHEQVREAYRQALLGQLQQLLANENVGPDFNAEEWLNVWLNSPVPALGQHAPAEFLKDREGFARISVILESMRSGAFH